MSVKSIILGMGGLVASSVAGLFGLIKTKESRDYKIKMEKFRNTVHRINGYFSSKEKQKSLTLEDPEHESWGQKFDHYQSERWSDLSKLFPATTRGSWEDMRDYCFKEAEENVDDAIKGVILANDSDNNNFSPKVSPFWSLCLTQKETSQ
ncbi:hypothetical protein MHF_1298 [Mycoplasma haemofelis Ohio2]|uniref:Uncharacterized protein n=1 Tax=Mycoplasma haemofelis (strain Ohio2) TaxID=859194 RepID=F6FG36_MYCHI|nr:hypothetical protein MHF_1298 [Mycoplasma haemofelis Ohio2]